MLLLGHLAKVQGLKGEFLLHALMDDPERLPGLKALVLAPPEQDLSHTESIQAPALPVKLRSFRWHQDRPCVALAGYPDRTSSEPFKGWALWMPESEATLEAGESFRHDWIGCEVLVAGQVVGEVFRLDPTPMGYDMVILKDLRPGRRGQREVPYIKAWWTLDLPKRQLHLDGPGGILDLDLMD